MPLTRRAFGTAVGATAATAAVGIPAVATPASAATPVSAAAAAPAEAARERPFRAARGKHSRRPNILFILGDDLGWADLSSYGSPHIHTPNLDRLGRQGVRFTDAYAGSATTTGRGCSISTSPPRTGRGSRRATRPRAPRSSAGSGPGA